MKHLDINNFNTLAKKHIFDDNRFDKDGFIIMENNSNYKSIRYYGFYNKSKKLCDKLITIIKKEKIPFMRSMLKWKNSILTSFNRIPIKCPKCGSLMKLCFDIT